ncbi:MAG: hypothetical protein FWD73_11790 [Polyangiaceae bacterium]|nr:hypothetical protein [Polyangiaceae bacterium]
MLDRIALHQTRLHTPGLGLDGKGVAMGGKGIILLQSLDRLVAWLAIYTREHSLDDLMPSLQIDVVKSKLGTREITLSFAAESSDRMDRLADVARLVGGLAFTGTSRHFVQYRDAAAPFGYDATELISTDATLVFYHDRFTQVYESEKGISLRSLLLRLMPHVDPAESDDDGPLILVAEQGLGPALIHYFVRSRVDGEVAVAEWPPESAFDDNPVRRHILRIANLPKRMRPLMSTIPGIVPFMPAGPGVAVEVGYRHPVSLRACPVFEAGGLVLLRGRGQEPWVLEKTPQMGDLRAFARIELRAETTATAEAEASVAMGAHSPSPVRVPLRMVSSLAPLRKVTATWITPSEIPLLRRIAYALPHQTIVQTQVAITPKGAFLRSSAGIEAIPLGMFFVEIHPALYMPAGYDFTPAVAPEVLYSALGASPSHVLFIDANARAVAIDASAFVPLETALVEVQAYEPLIAEAIELALGEKPAILKLDSLPVFALNQLEPPPPAGPPGGNSPPALPPAANPTSKT